MEIIKEPKVEILDFIRPENSTTEIIDFQLFKVYAGYRRCYSAEDNILKFPGMEEISNDGYLKDLTHEKISNFIRRMRKSPHTSPLEHGTMTVHVSNVSRSAINQWVRHRIANHSQKSLRYTDSANLKFCMPESVLKNEKLLLKWIDHLEATEKLYNESLSEEYNIPKEDARAILPLNVSTSIVTTMNFSAWIHFFNVRCCNRAQKEIRIIANAILDAAKSAYPCIFENVGPNCIGVDGKFKGCPEEHPCGNPPIKKK